jgi:hypothetical protein
MNLAERLAQGVSALREGRPADAATRLREVVDHPDFRAAPDLLDLRARAASLLAQALLATDEVGPADRYAREALEAVEELGDSEGIAQIHALRQEIMGRALALRNERERHARRARLRTVSIEELLGSTVDPCERVGLLIERASAASEAGDDTEARELAERATAMADREATVKEQVLSRLLVAQVMADKRLDALRSAYRLALAANEPGLITGIAQTAAQVGIPHSTIDGPA